VSFYNATGDTTVLPTPVIGVMGVLVDVERRTPIGFSEAGDSLVLLGEIRGGLAWAWVAHRHLGGNPPPVDLERERLLGEVLVAGSRDGSCRRHTTCPTGASRSRSWSRACASGTVRG